MVFTPTTRPSELSGPLSPLILASQPRDSPGIYDSSIPPLPSSSSSVGSGSFIFHVNGNGNASGSRTPSFPPPLRKSSTGSFSKLSEFRLDSPLTPGENGVEDSGGLNELGSGVQGVRHVELSVDAGEWKHPVFKAKVLGILRHLKVPLWTSSLLTPSSIHLQKVSGALTNAVFFVSFNPNPQPTSPSMSPLLTPTMPPSDPAHPPSFPFGQIPPTLLLRIYGPSSGALISRTEELRILHVLSTTYGLGPKVFGTFLNGRIEQFFPSRALTALELRDRLISRGIARRMRELHSVDLRLLGYEDGKDGEPMVWKCLKEWAGLAGEVMNSLAALGGNWEVWVEKFGLHRVGEEVEAYRRWVEGESGKGKGVVFAHNDTQYGNLLKLDKELPANVPDHHRYIVIDFEYAAPNPRGYDIANHFHEWRANYHHPTLSHTLQPHFPYPTITQRDDFYRAYLSIEMDGDTGQETMHNRKEIGSERVERLEREVRIWSPACSVFWALWGIVQAEEQVEKVLEGREGEGVEFDYLSYALERLEMFRQEARELGVPLPKSS